LGAADAIFDRLEVPGALEIPAAIGLAADQYDGFVALGCVIRGETYHFEIVAQESARGLMDLSVNRGLSIGNGILTVENEEQAMARASHDRLDKGGDAVRACLALIDVKSRFETQ
jgi:6,7-dimethyl-8-ribityllumazine synthase